MKPSEHQPLHEQLSAYLDGELTEDQRAQVEEILATDPDARRLLDELAATVAALHDLPRAKASDEFAQSMRSRLERRALLGGERSTLAAPPPVPSRLGRWMTAAAVLALAFVGTYVTWSVSSQKPTPPKQQLARRSISPTEEAADTATTADIDGTVSEKGSATEGQENIPSRGRTGPQDMPAAPLALAEAKKKGVDTDQAPLWVFAKERTLDKADDAVDEGVHIEADRLHPLTKSPAPPRRPSRAVLDAPSSTPDRNAPTFGYARARTPTGQRDGHAMRRDFSRGAQTKTSPRETIRRAGIEAEEREIHLMQLADQKEGKQESGKAQPAGGRSASQPAAYGPTVFARVMKRFSRAAASAPAETAMANRPVTIGVGGSMHVSVAQSQPSTQPADASATRPAGAPTTRPTTGQGVPPGALCAPPRAVSAPPGAVSAPPGAVSAPPRAVSAPPGATSAPRRAPAASPASTSAPSP